LPNSVFSPYTGIATNILFFEKGKPTKEIWYYQMKLKEGIKAYNKTNPMTYDDFTDVIEWCKNKKENGNAWKVKVEDIKDYNLDIKNPNDVEETLDLSPHELIDTILKDEEKTLQLLKEVKELIQKEIPK
jgi:type I restriction enzyme M protein